MSVVWAALAANTNEQINVSHLPREKPHTGAAAREQPRDSPVIES